MTQDQKVSKSLPEQIFSDLFKQLEEDAACDARLILALRTCLNDGVIGDRSRIQSAVMEAQDRLSEE